MHVKLHELQDKPVALCVLKENASLKKSLEFRYLEAQVEFLFFQLSQLVSLTVCVATCIPEEKNNYQALNRVLLLREEVYKY